MPLSRSFIQAPALGLVRNYGGGIGWIGVTPTTHPITLGGDAAAMPLVLAAADHWRFKGGTWTGGAFSGVGAKARGMKHFVWADASDAGRGQIIGYDALVVIVARDCAIPTITALPEYGVIPVTALATLFGSPTTPGAQRIYTYAPTQGNRRYLARHLRAWGAAAGKEFGPGAVTVSDDLAMMDLVAADPHGIGYCSSSVVDFDRVRVLGLQRDGVTTRWPNDNVKYGSVRVERSHCPYPLIRPLRIEAGGDGSQLATIFAQPAFLAGPLYTASYYTP